MHGITNRRATAATKNGGLESSKMQRLRQLGWLILRSGATVKSETIAVQQLFQDHHQSRVPFYQRTYVWDSREDQWERLWADIQDKSDARVIGAQPAPHFLGAAVLEPQPRAGLLGVETLHIIDGQQRLTTLQYVFCALAMVLRRAWRTAASCFDRCLFVECQSRDNGARRCGDLQSMANLP